MHFIGKPHLEKQLDAAQLILVRQTSKLSYNISRKSAFLYRKLLNLTQKQCPKCSAQYTQGSHVCDLSGVNMVEPGPSIGSAGSPCIDFMSIGKGLRGEVFKAKHASIDRQVAIKILHAHFGKRGAEVRRVVEDANTLSQMESENIAKVYEAGYINEHQPYIVTEYLKGQTLATYLHSDSLVSESASLSIFKQCAKALMQVEKHNIVHGDLTLANIVGDFISEKWKCESYGLCPRKFLCQRVEGAKGRNWKSSGSVVLLY